MRHANNLIGQKFGRLTVVSRAENSISPSGSQKVMWNCLCECGNSVSVRASSLQMGVTNSCGCLHKESLEEIRKKYIYKHGGACHGGSKEKLYFTWLNIKKRCENQCDHNYKNYGGRGITLCKEWHDYSVFREWAMNSGYNPAKSGNECTIDRIDVNGNYEPQNCRWVNRKVQNNNRRNNRYIEFNGQKLTLSQWAEKLNVNYDTLKYRVDNWPLEQALANI